MSDGNANPGRREEPANRRRRVATARRSPGAWVPAEPPDGVRPLLVVLSGTLDAEDVTVRHLPEIRRLIEDPVSAYADGWPGQGGWRRGIDGCWPPGEADAQFDALFASATGDHWLRRASAAAARAGAVIMRDGYTGCWAWERVVPRLREALSRHAPTYLLPPRATGWAGTEDWRQAWDAAMRDLANRGTAANG